MSRRWLAAMSSPGNGSRHGRTSRYRRRARRSGNAARSTCSIRCCRSSSGRWVSSLQYPAELVSFEQQGDSVRAVIRNADNGANYPIRAGYPIGADGAASRVRDLLGITMTGTHSLTYTTHVLFRSAQLPQVHDKGNGYRFLFIGPQGTWLTITSVNGNDLWRMQIIGNSEPRKPTAAEIRDALTQAVGQEFDYQVIDVMPWVRRELVADSYGNRRVLIAGDAAHLMSPTGAFGMNTGIQDAVDLGWKLDAVLRGSGHPALLDTYEIERRPVARRNVAEASENLRRMLATRSRKPPANLVEPGPRPTPRGASTASGTQRSCTRSGSRSE